MSNNTIGYFLAKSGLKKNINVIVEIEIPSDAKTNIDRDDIYDKLNAEYKTNKYIVKKIYDQYLNEYSMFFNNYSCPLKLGELVCNKDVYYSEIDGEHVEAEKVKKFYMSKHIAIGLTDIMDGICTLYHKNGRKSIEYTKKNGKKNGKCYKWLENGQIYEETYYLNNLLDGECKFYDIDGKLEDHVLYQKNKIIEILDFDLFKKYIDYYVDNIIEEEKKIVLIDFDSKYTSNNSKHVKKSKKTAKLDNDFEVYYTTFLNMIDNIFSKPVKKEEFVKYKNEKLIFLIKAFFEKINTTYGKSYLECNNKKDYIKEELNQYIKYFMKTDNKDILLYLLQLNNFIFI